MTIYRTFTLLIEKFPRFSFINAIITLSGVGSIRAFIMTIRYLIEAQYVIVKEGNTEKILLNDDVNDLGDKISFNRIVVLLSGSSRAALGSNISDDASSNTENGSSSAQHEVKPVQNHVTALSPVLSAEGVPSPGWASDGALFKYSREAVRADPWRVKEWDWYQVSNSHVALQFTFGHASYAGQVGVMLFDFQKQKTIYVCDCILPVPVLWMKLDASAGEDSVLEYKKKGMWMQITTKEKGKVRRIACKTEEFECDVTLSRLNDNSIALVVPFKESENQFYFNEKINCMSASGKATVNGVDFIFRNASQTEKRKDSSISHIVEPSSKLDSSSSEAKESLLLDNSSEKEEQANEQDDNMKAKSEVGKDVCVDRADCDEAWGLLDWGRGVWPYHNEWYWSNATGRVNGKVFGFNLGCGFGETSKATENCLFFEGSLHKLGNVKIICDHQDYMKEWKLEDEEGRVALALSPTFDRKTETKMLWVDNCTHQMFGKFHGVVSLDDGTKLEIDNIFGFSEYAVNNW
ncbi:putative DUF2804 family protein [Monocercomonoides exilis]|uniref:putative DUF2804 family protein n=1 Tax=Monocercomonoides exilis TaxID=2049356 RepID=UPI00355A3734|nr:putative DUF2804 family protein [Monocercomonoides exilis]|eukprot:MONOS_6215.1-p1 / transcript=MONOS_6215.1 / gene=MONOS_6215 / organism=Monocercomonoides_exilis_PA203 / gene_product=putative uncharacterized protein / transcript_product=putative uncharacterized protein / location=Mono_scaffold00193:10109-11668(-) / protein_length=520 / sequence_SO=supercontig / SO=protein_coding / is_pseudo=false